MALQAATRKQFGMSINDAAKLDNNFNAVALAGAGVASAPMVAPMAGAGFLGLSDLTGAATMATANGLMNLSDAVGGLCINLTTNPANYALAAALLNQEVEEGEALWAPSWEAAQLISEIEEVAVPIEEYIESLGLYPTQIFP